MEVRYLFIHPPDLTEILLSTPVIRAVVKSVEHAEVICAIPEAYSWLLESNPYVTSLVVYEKSPSKHINEFRDVAADYIVDLIGGRKLKWFKNRLRVMDFTLNQKSLNEIRSQDSFIEAANQYKKAAFDMLGVFDLEDDKSGLDFFYGHNRSFVEKAIPESFLDGYAVLDMPDEGPGDMDIAGPISELISRIERPLVLCGDEGWRLTGEEIMRRTGCTILSTCGDFFKLDRVFIRSGAKVLINIEEKKDVWATIFNKPHFYIDLKANPDSWKSQVEEIRNYLKLG